MTVKAVFFDVGETLINEERLWNAWATYLKIPAARFHSTLDAVIMAGEHHHHVFQLLEPGFDLERARRERAASGDLDLFSVEDVYPDVASCLASLHAAGYLIGIAGNQTREMEIAMKTLGLPADIIASSAKWGVQKPSAAFFEKLIKAVGFNPPEIAYVGDRLDNDVIPARKAGLATVFLERGPWGRIHCKWPEAKLADIRLTSLADLLGALKNLP
jgi:HAD superfamily hydrolase (TIGR01662 family)